MPKCKLNELIIIRDNHTDQIFGIYDVSNMTGDLKDYYDGSFDNYDDYENDMIDRGAKTIPFKNHYI